MDIEDVPLDTIRDFALKWKHERDEAVLLLKRVREYFKDSTEFKPGVDWELLIKVRDFVKAQENDQ